MNSPIRQWVCSLPWRLRVPLAYDRALCADVIAAFIGAVQRSLRWRAKRALVEVAQGCLEVSTNAVVVAVVIAPLALLLAVIGELTAQVADDVRAAVVVEQELEPGSLTLTVPSSTPIEGTPPGAAPGRTPSLPAADPRHPLPVRGGIPGILGVPSRPS